MNDPYYKMIELFETKTNFGFARFNDGEMKGIANVGAVAARGCQRITPDLQEKLLWAINHEQKHYYKGYPCSTCFPKHRELYDQLVPKSYKYQIPATTFCNGGNWNRAMEAFHHVCYDRRVVWISGADQVLDAVKSMFKMNIVAHIKVPQREGWYGYPHIKDLHLSFFENQLVILSCGPMSRVLVAEWFKERPDCTFFDAGSLFDPYTRNVWLNCHTGKLAYCMECNNGR
jgi:hypothetical protein